MTTSAQHSEPAWVKVFPYAIVLIASWLLLTRGLERDLNHDEHQFIAPGALLSREGLLPYRDYPLFHLPNLVFAYAAMDRVTGGRLLLGAKLLSITASIVLVIMLVGLLTGRRDLEWRSRLLLTSAGVVLLLYDPVFLYTAGKTWNHEVPTALIVGALLLQARFFETPHLGFAVIAGLLGGLGAGCRLTFGPMLIPLCLLAFLVKGSVRTKVLHGLCWGGGAFIGLLPSIWLWALAPEQFVFGNLEFPRLRLSDPTNTRIQKTIRWSAKLRYFFKEIVRPSWPLFAVFLLLAIRPGWNWVRYRRGNTVAGFALAVLPFALLGCFAPSRYQYQHFYGVIAIVAVAVFASLPVLSGRWNLRITSIAALVMVVGAVIAGSSHDRVNETYRIVPEEPKEWFVFDYPRQAAEIRSYVSNGKVLTLSPTLPLEAHLSIYSEFASGPFAFRSAHLMTVERAKRTDMVAPGMLWAFLEAAPPAAILTGVEDDALEEPLVEYAKAHAYRKVELERKRELWVRSFVPSAKAN